MTGMTGRQMMEHAYSLQPEVLPDPAAGWDMLDFARAGLHPVVQCRDCRSTVALPRVAWVWERPGEEELGFFFRCPDCHEELMSLVGDAEEDAGWDGSP